MSLFIGISFPGGKLVKGLLNGADAGRITPFIQIDPDGQITIFSIKPEMGQGTFQSIPALIAEELELTLEQVTIKLTNGEPVFGNGQAAGGSSSVRNNYEKFRKAGAAAREMLLQAAGKQWGVPVAECTAADAKIWHKAGNRSLTYGELATEASKLDVPENPKLKDPADFRLIGKSMKRPDVPLKVNGTAEFGIDVEAPGMVYASIERSPVVGGTLKSFDDKEAMKVPGVLKVVRAERIMGKYQTTGVAVIANTYWAALQGRKALVIEWDTKGYETFNSAAYEQQLRDMAGKTGLEDTKKGDVNAVSIPAGRKLEALYETPMVAHHTMEPMNCVARVKGDSLEIWASTQVPGSVTGKDSDDLPGLTGFAPEKVKLNSTFIGGGFGRRLYLDFMVEAVNIAKQFDAPVKVIWTREDTTRFDPFRPMTFSQMKGGLSPDGKLLSFEHKVISPSYFAAYDAAYDNSKPDRIMMEGTGEQEYEIPNVLTSFVMADYHVPISAWRSVTSSTTAFAHECFMDEMAHLAKKDPMEFRISMLPAGSDTRRVLEKLREVSNWNKPLPKGKGRGVGQWNFFAGLCGQVVEVSYDKKTKSVKIDKVYAVIDLGKVVNPDMVKAQVEGAVVMAITAAVKPGITLKNGQVEQSNFHDNPILRIYEMPEVEVHILTGDGKIKGVGEPGLPPLAPALANAVFAATGKRIRRLPFDLGKIS